MDKLNLRVLLIDDHVGILRGLESIIFKNYPTAQIASFTRGIKALYDIRDKKYDLYIIDLELEDIGGMALIHKIREQDAESNIIVHTMHDGVWDILNLRKANVNGIVLKASDELDLAISKVLDGEIYYCKRFKYLNKEDNTINPDTFLLNEKLSKTELQIIRYIAKGLSDMEISELMPQKMNTIKKYKQRIYSKFEVHGSEQLLIKAIANGYIKTSSSKSKKGY